MKIFPQLFAFVAGLGFAVAVAAPARVDEVWRLDDLKRIGGHAVTVVGSPTPASDGRTALRFDGANDGIFVDVIPIAGARAFTIEVLFSPKANGPEAQRFFHLQDASGARALIEIRTNRQGGWWLDTFLWNGKEEQRGTTLIDAERVHPADKWYWVALRFDGRTMTDFVNGDEELQGQVALAPFADGKISLGVRQNKIYWFKGAIAEVRFHDAALAPEELQRVKP